MERVNGYNDIACQCLLVNWQTLTSVHLQPLRVVGPSHYLVMIDCRVTGGKRVVGDVVKAKTVEALLGGGGGGGGGGVWT